MQLAMCRACRPTVVDLFCGAGGLSLGFQTSGFQIIYAADNWEPAIRTYCANFDHDAYTVSLTWDIEVPRADVFIGGPPCQGFSSAGARKPGDTRNTLVAVFAHLVAANRPTAFLFENVEGFLTGDGGKWVVDLIKPLVKAGYAITIRKINAANYGVPQLRKRVIVIGGLGWLPGLPEPTHQAFGAPGAHLAASGLPLTPTVAEALSDLPPALPKSNGSSDAFDHTFRIPSAEDRKRMELLRPGQTMRDLPPEYWHRTYRRRAYRRVMDGTPSERRGGPPAGLRRLRPDEPSKAITSGAPSEFVHPFEDRTLTLRECARLQTFPDSFVFVGNKSDKALLIGNAVPPRLAHVLAAHLRSQLERKETLTARPGVHEFTPTFSNGLSPALRRTYELVAPFTVQREIGYSNEKLTGEQLTLFHPEEQS